MHEACMGYKINYYEILVRKFEKETTLGVVGIVAALK